MIIAEAFLVIGLFICYQRKAARRVTPCGRPWVLSRNRRNYIVQSTYNKRSGILKVVIKTLLLYHKFAKAFC